MLLSSLFLLPLSVVAAASSSSSSSASTSSPPSFLNKLPLDITSQVSRTSQLRTHSLHAPYVDQDLQNRWWDFGADAIVNTNRHVRLTQDRSSETGWLWSRLPLKAENFVVEVEFEVRGKSSSYLHGDGFAMWISSTRATPGPVFGSVDHFKGLGVFFDTYPNSRHSYSFPRITAMLGDGSTTYDHDHDNAETELAACSIDFRSKDVATRVRLVYLKGKILQVQTHVDKWDEWTVCFEVDGFELPTDQDLYLGFTALTGEVSDAHDIISISTDSIILQNDVPPQQQKQQQQQQQAPQQIIGQRDTDDVKSKKPFLDAAREAHERNRQQGNKKNKSKQGGGGGGGGAVGAFVFIIKAIGVLAFCGFVFAAYRTWDTQKKGRRF